MVSNRIVDAEVDEGVTSISYTATSSYNNNNIATTTNVNIDEPPDPNVPKLDCNNNNSNNILNKESHVFAPSCDSVIDNDVLCSISQNNNNKPSSLPTPAAMNHKASFAIDHKQLDRTSNQSGSDSGLGCTNSISSDNSIAIAQNQIQRYYDNDHGNKTRGIPSNTSGAFTKLKEDVPGKHPSLPTNKSGPGPQACPSYGERQSELISVHSQDTMAKPKTSTHAEISEPASTTQPSMVVSTSSMVANFKLATNAGANALNSPGQGFKAPNDDSVNAIVDTLSLDGSREISRASRDTSMISDQNIGSHSPTTGSLIKSVLKRSTPLKPGVKHNRSVTFNQTVIVFCEELESTSSVTPECDARVHYDHQPEAADNFDSLDERSDTGTGADVVTQPFAKDKATANSDMLNFNEQPCEQLTDDQLIGLLEDEALLKTLRLDGDDYSEDDFPINRINSGQSYFCDDAMSDDYDSDSESSRLFEKRSGKKALSIHAPTGQDTNISRDLHVTNSLTTDNNKATKTRSTIRDDADLIRSQATSEKSSQNQNTSVNRSEEQQKSMPARMKVSALDRNSLRRNPNRYEGDTEPPVDQTSEHHTKLGQTQTQSKSHNKSHPPSHRNAVITKQANVEPVILLKPVLVAQPSNDQTHHPARVNNSIRADQQYRLANTIDGPSFQIKSNTASIPASTIQQSLGTADSSLPSAPVRQQVIGQVCGQASTHECLICRENSRTRQSDSIVRTDVTTTSAPSSQDQQSRVSLRYNVPQQAQTGLPHTGSSTSSSLAATAALGVTTNVLVGQQQRQYLPSLANQSCVSCREVSNKALGIPIQAAFVRAPTGGNSGQRQMAVGPIAYQVVNVIDQNGNRVRALSIVRPSNQQGSSASQPSQLMAGQRILISQVAGQRFPNPVFVNGQILNKMQQQNGPRNITVPVMRQQQPSTITNIDRSQGQPTALSYSLVHPAVQCHQIQSTNQQLQGHHDSGLGQSVGPNGALSVKTSVAPDFSKQHTIYCVRQPLNSQILSNNLHPSCDLHRALSKSFPDAPEIRRLDGLRAPAPTSDSELLGERFLGQDENNQPALVGNQRRDDEDDPTFGFSKRPAVKVVATNVLKPCKTINRLNNLHKIKVGGHNDDGCSRPIVHSGSQTLDRAQSSGQRISHQTVKDSHTSISGTTSMSNIQGSSSNNCGINTLTIGQTVYKTSPITAQQKLYRQSAAPEQSQSMSDTAQRFAQDMRSKRSEGKVRSAYEKKSNFSDASRGGHSYQRTMKDWLYSKLSVIGSGSNPRSGI